MAGHPARREDPMTDWVRSINRIRRLVVLILLGQDPICSYSGHPASTCSRRSRPTARSTERVQRARTSDRVCAPTGLHASSVWIAELRRPTALSAKLS
jgi:hypothetical protein